MVRNIVPQSTILENVFSSELCRSLEYGLNQTNCILRKRNKPLKLEQDISGKHALKRKENERRRSEKL